MIAPTVVLEPGDDARVMQDEIFGPILPIRGYRDLDDAIAYVEGRDRPLALYPFSHDRATVERILGRILAGGVTVNDTLLHFAAGNLPFGGVGARSEEHTSELQSLMRISYAVFCLKKTNNTLHKT